MYFFSYLERVCFSIPVLTVASWPAYWFLNGVEKKWVRVGKTGLKYAPPPPIRRPQWEVFEENFGPRSQTERPRNEGTGARKANTPPAWLAKCPGPWWQLSSVSSAMHRAWCGSSSLSLWGLIEKAFVIVLAPEKSPRFLSRSQTPQFTLQYSHQ